MNAKDLRQAAWTAAAHMGDGIPDCWQSIVKSLSDHILATVREDDDKPIGGLWFRGLTGDGHMLNLSEGRYLVLYSHGLSINDSAHSVDLHEIKTRGEFRTLCRLLGVTLLEPTPTP